MKQYSRGQTLALVSLIIPVLVGALALGTDVAMLYYNQTILQKAADAGVLAGANYLPDNPSQAITTAKLLAQSNGITAAEISSTTVASGNASIAMTIQRTVPYSFGQILGLSNGTAKATASASPQYAPSTVNATSPSQVPAGGDNNGNNGTYCGSTGACELLPMGLDSRTTYTDGQQINLQQGQVMAGNWDLLALGGVGGNNLRTRIANGYNGMVSVGDWVTTEPGKKVGPVDQGFGDRLTRAASVDPTGTYSSHIPTNPRILILPVVNWAGQGRSTVQVTAFASVWLDSYNQGTVTVHLISQVMANTFGDPTAPNFGARGTPILLK